MDSEINIFDIILQLVKTDKTFDEADLGLLLPIDNVYKGFGLYGNSIPLSFDPQSDFDIDPYELIIDLENEKQRIQTIEKIRS